MRSQRGRRHSIPMRNHRTKSRHRRLHRRVGPASRLALGHARGRVEITLGGGRDDVVVAGLWGAAARGHGTREGGAYGALCHRSNVLGGSSRYRGRYRDILRRLTAVHNRWGTGPGDRSRDVLSRGRRLALAVLGGFTWEHFFHSFSILLLFFCNKKNTRNFFFIFFSVI